MSTMIEEIRKRIKAASENTDEAGAYDEYESGQRVGLATALQIIDEVEREHPVPSDVEEAAEMAARRKYPYEGGTKGAICEASIPIFCNGFKAGIAYERERLMKGALEVEVYWNRGNEPRVIVHLPKGSAMPGDKVSVIIIKK